VIALLTSFNVLDKLQMNISLVDNPMDMKMHQLFEVGMRVNPKRSFLFVSKLLGKHLAVSPDVPKITGYLLAELFLNHVKKDSMGVANTLMTYLSTEKKTEEVEKALRIKYDLKENTLFIGFAETATGLGHAVFSAFNNSSFVHTTREDVASIRSIFDFQEEHSHATDHRCYLEDEELVKKAEHIVLIDDEMTTGKTSLNLIRSLHKVYPKNKFTILSILDWRNQEQKEEYREVSKLLGCEINVVSLITGELTINKEEFLKEACMEQNNQKSIPTQKVSTCFNPKVEVFNGVEFISYVQDTGRFGITSKMHDRLEQNAKEVGDYLSGLRKNDATLVVGTGEFMYIPSRISSYMGKGVSYKSTTRSPIFPCKREGYPVHDRIQFADEKGISYFLYNVKKDRVKEVFVIAEPNISQTMMETMTNQLKESNVENITFVTL